MQRKLALSSSALALVFIGGAASADVTGADVWADWQSYMQGFGYEMTGTQSQSGNRLTIGDAAMVFTLPEGEGNVSFTIGTLEFIDNADGTVSVVYPEAMPITFDLNPPEGAPIKGQMTFRHTAPQMVVSGQTDDMLYTYVAQGLGMALDELEADGTTITRDMLSMSMEMDNVAFVTRMTNEDLRSYSQDMKADTMRYKVAFSEPEENSEGSYQGQLSNLDLQGTGTVPNGIEAGNLNAMIAAGLDTQGEFTFTDGSTAFSVQAPDGTLVGKTASGTGSLSVAMGSDGLIYDLEQKDVSLDMQVPGFPLPVAMSIATSAANVTMPVQSGPQEQDFAFGFALEDFTISDSIWGLFDPAGQLPRDPATLALDLTGTAKVLIDLFSADQAFENDIPEPLGEMNSVNINTLILSALGATITGEGAFTFDNTDMTTFDGMPRPSGAFDLRAEGLNGLIDTLVNMGILPQEQAMGARMMMGLFTVPAGDDVLTSRIEVNDEGRVLANGQMIR